jgi:hypothetical protein
MTQPSLHTPPSPGVLDNSLLLDKVRQLVLSGSDPDAARRMLTKRDVWLSLGPEQALEWSRLAQICTDPTTALDLLNHVHSTAPGFKPAWLEHIDLLSMLEKRKELAALKALAGQVAPDFLPLFPLADHADHLSDTPVKDRNVDAPFALFKREQELIDLYMRLFSGRTECFARQWADKAEGKSGYVPVRHPMTEKDIRDHLNGIKTLGIYLLHEDDTVSLGVIDVDLIKSLREASPSSGQKNVIRREIEYLFQQVRESSRKNGLTCLPEFSGGKGYHFWYFFREPIAASRVKSLLKGLTEPLAKDLTCFNLEVFPKQDRLAGKGLGNLVKLPLGIHRKTGKPSHFIPKMQGDIWDQLEVLKTVEPVSRAVCSTWENAREPAPVVSLHPRYEEWCETYPELAVLLNKCPTLGQVIALCRQGRPLSLKEEKVLYGTIGFLTRGKLLMHALLKDQSEYNPHLVDLKLSRLRGSPLGCKRIHNLLESTLDFCRFEEDAPYPHPLLFCKKWLPADMTRAEKIENLQDALTHLQNSLDTVRRFLPKPG